MRTYFEIAGLLLRIFYASTQIAPEMKDERQHYTDKMPPLPDALSRH